MSTETAAKLMACAADLQRLAVRLTEAAHEMVAQRGSSPRRGVGRGMALIAPERGTQTERAMALFHQRPDGLSRKQLGGALPDVTQNSLSSVVQRLVERGDIVRVGHGFYRLAPSGPR